MMRKILLAVLLIFPSVLSAQDSPGVTCLARLWHNSSNRVALEGDYAYVAEWADGLRIIDISNPANPFSVCSYATPDLVRSVTLSGSYAYVAANNSGVRIIDISNPTDPQEVGFYDTPGNAYSVALSGDYAYVADAISGLLIIDISDPEDPQEIGSYITEGFAEDVAVSGDYAYVTSYDHDMGYSYFRIFDVSNPADPIRVGHFDIFETYNGIFVSGDHAFIAVQSLGIVIINIANPAITEYVGTCYGSWHAQNVNVYGDIACAAVGRNGFKIYDISNLAEPALIGFYETQEDVKDAVLVDNITYVSEGEEFGVYDCYHALTVPECRFSDIPTEYIVSSPHPNPFNPMTYITVSLPDAAFFQMMVYNVLGQRVDILANKTINAGHHSFTFDATKLSGGVYLVHAYFPGEMNQVRKVVFIK